MWKWKSANVKAKTEIEYGLVFCYEAVETVSHFHAHTHTPSHIKIIPLYPWVNLNICSINYFIAVGVYV